MGTISSQLGVHRETVMRVLTQAGGAPTVPAQRTSGVPPYLPFIEETLKQLPNLTASRLHTMAAERGYEGRAPTTFATSSPATVHVPRHMPTCACAPCPVNRGNATGATSATSRSGKPSAP